MDENAIRQWFIDCFGPIQGEMAWNQFSNMPEELRDQLMSQDVSKLPKPAEVRSMMQAFTAGGLNTFGDIQHITEEVQSTSNWRNHWHCSRPMAKDRKPV